MAYYAALVSVVQSLKEIIDHDQYSKFLLDKQQIASVYEKLSHLETLLEDYSPKDEEAADCLERRIRDAAYQVQDKLESQHIIEYKSLNLISSEEKSHRINTVLPRIFLSKLKRTLPRQRQDMEKVKEEVDSIVEEVTMMKIKKIHIIEELELTNYHSASEEKQTSCGNNVVGFEEQRKTIINQLFIESSKLEVVPLVGMGGIGKTTLAKSIFDDELIVYHFDRRAWVTVSQNYHMQKILRDIQDSMHKTSKNLSKVKESLSEEEEEEEESLKQDIYQSLKGMRYLLIVDDVWDTKVWNDMKRIFPNDNNESRILLTTRQLDVANASKSRCGSLHQMQFLNEDQSWDLLREKVFGRENCPQELEVIGRLIAETCRGLPLAIVVVAGLLSVVNKTRNDWEGIARNVSSVATKNDERLSKTLSLSYNWLPHHLKPCFLYIGCFPEDYQIPISKLIKLWMAEGFLKPDKFKSLEEIGEEYLEDLVKRNLVLMNEKKSSGEFKYCSIHDVLRDLCVKTARDEGFLHIMDGNDDYLYTKGTRNVIRRLYIHPACSQLKAEEFGSHVGSIICFGDNRELLPFASRFKLLRALHALELDFDSFPVEVLELHRLRYLALGYIVDRGEFKIPPQIVKLEKLQTLVFRARRYPANNGVDLSQIWKMPNLRHVDVYLLELSLPIPSNCILENIQTLSTVLNFRFTDRAVQIIPNIQKLKVVYWDFEPTTIWEEFCLYNLVRLCQLETLNIELDPFSFDAEDHISFPERFSFPPKLKTLTLGGCRIPWKDMTMVGSLPNLEVLKLNDDAFVGDEWEPIEREFPKLKVLVMGHLGSLKYWRAQNTHFPCLEHLEIFNCMELEEIPSEIGDIPTLKLIEVYDGRKSIHDSALRIQEEQRNMGNDGLEVHRIRY